MSKDKTHPQAFPYSGVGDECNVSRGMLLRDYFAAKAMQALIVDKMDQCRDSEDVNNYDLSESLTTDCNWFNAVASVADASYIVADAMLKARKI